MLRDNHELVAKLIHKMHLFNLTNVLYEDVLAIVGLMVTYEPTKDRVKYLSYFEFDINSLLCAIHETNAHTEHHSEDGYNSWLSYIIENKQDFGLDDDDFTRENLEDKLLPYDFVDAVVEEYNLIEQTHLSN
jgi:hypothetical protein